MKQGIAYTAAVAIRREPADRSEMVSQILFGEHFAIVDRINAWLLIRLAYDGYTGWVHSSSISILGDEEFNLLETQSPYILPCQGHARSLTNKNHKFILPPGSVVRFISQDKKEFRIGREIYSLKVNSRPDGVNRNTLVKTALQYMNAPYLWGGRTTFGIDCSGLVQAVFKINGIPVPRDVNHQVESGTLVSFIEEARQGDLAFFDDEEGKIIHVGMIVEDEKIIHASGMVRIDKIDHQGIFMSDNGGYSHKLRVIKNVFDSSEKQ